MPLRMSLMHALLARAMPSAHPRISDPTGWLVRTGKQNCVESGGEPSFGREREVKTRATGRVAPRPQATTVRFHDRAADGQPHAGPVRLRGKERVEDLICLLRGQADAGVT